MRRVFSNDQTVHVWAARSQSDGRSSGGAIFFDGDSIYSYGRHFRMAQFVSNGRGDVAVLINPDSYSVTTSKHQSMVRRAIPPYCTCFYAPRAERDDAAVRKFYEDAAELAWRKAGKARRYGPMHIEAAQQYVEDFNRYAEFFGLDERMAMPANAAEAIEAANQRAAIEGRRQAEADRVAAERRAKENAEREARDAERMAQWLDGADVHPPYAQDIRVRIRGDVLQTSAGAEVPISVAPMLWERVCTARDAGIATDYTAHAVRVGHFELRKIHGNGDVQIGCHFIKYAELARIAALLNLPVASCA